jgi:hypothetical protein
VREEFMCLLYFGIGGKKNSCAKYKRVHLNGRSTPGVRDSSLNHFVTRDKVVQTCVFKLDFVHSPNQAEQVGIDFVSLVSNTQKQTNMKLSSADKDGPVKLMYYYMILVLDPGFSAKEIGNAKAASTSINAKGAELGMKQKQLGKTSNGLGMERNSRTHARTRGTVGPACWKR